MKPIIFIHIAKTAGTSLRHLLSTETNGIWKDLNNVYSDWGGLEDRPDTMRLLNYSSEINDLDYEHEFLYLPDISLWKYWLNNITDKSKNKIIELHINTTDNLKLVPPDDLLENEMYENFNWLTMLRNPIQRVISEYFYLKHNAWSEDNQILYGQMESNIWAGNPKRKVLWADKVEPTIDEWLIKNKASHNGQVKWLLGKGYISDYDVTQEDFDKLIDRMESLNFKVGILESMNKTIKYWNKSFGYNLKRSNLPHIRKGLNKEIVNNETINLIGKNNSFDFKLYSYYSDKLNNLFK